MLECLIKLNSQSTVFVGEWKQMLMIAILLRECSSTINLMVTEDTLAAMAAVTSATGSMVSGMARVPLSTLTAASFKVISYGANLKNEEVSQA